jgi:7,8-dihydroneopterin 2',3'-cyclic phosphate phosphodiesterase
VDTAIRIYSKVEEMLTELLKITDLIRDPSLRKLVLDFLRDPPSDLNQDALPLEVCPAGAYHHHSYPGGLIQHTISVSKLSLSLCDIVEEQYGGKVNRDIVLAGAILHDLMKVYCYEQNGGTGFQTSEYGGFIDHLTLMVSELYRKVSDSDLIHVVASHHGDISPTKPKTLEALIVSVADQADSDLNGRLLRAAEYLLRKSGEQRPMVRSSAEAMMVVQAKKADGWEGVQKLVQKLKSS